ncbi:MAG: nicotinate-nucleotide adenylyltransferase [Betaproteobacteria bacterium]
MPSGADILGVFGGTFDPVHFGHLRLAEEARQDLGLPQVRWIPAGQPPHRQVPQVTARHRLDMVRLAVAENAAFSVDPAEVEAERPSFSVPTLERLRTEVGERRPLVLLLGADAFAGLSTWHRWRELLELAHLGVAHRPGYTIDAENLPPELADLYLARSSDDAAVLAAAPAGRVVTFPMTPLAISATRVRQLLVDGRSPRYLIPDSVIAYIQRHNLYQRL